MDRHGVLALLKAVAASTPEEIKEVEEAAVIDFLRRVGTNVKLYEKRTMSNDNLFLVNIFYFFYIILF
jgi:hypothetical protein